MIRLYFVFMFLIVPLFANASQAQSCWRYDRNAACASYPLTDFTLSTPLPGAAGLPQRHADFATNLGWLFKTHKRLDLGAALFFSAYLNGGWHSQWGLHGRARVHLNEKWQLQISPGVIISDSPFPNGFAGYSAALEVMFKDWVGLATRLDIVRSYSEGHDTVFLIGLKTGSYVGMAVTGVGAVVGGIAYIANSID